MICNKILGKFTKFGEKTDKNSRSGEQIYGRGGAQCAPLGLYRVNDILITGETEDIHC